MGLRRLMLAILLSAMTVPLVAAEWVASDAGETAIFAMKHAPFPHESRKDGFTSKETVYPAETHYADSSVGLFIPKGYVVGEKTDLLFYFHGWGNTIAGSFEQFKLREQVAASRKNVILVFPEGPVNANDSGLGKLEDADGLKNLVGEVLETLTAEKKIPSANAGRILLSGHSGAFRGIAFCLDRGGMEEHVSDVFLLDAAYANTDYMGAWAIRRKGARLSSVFTDHLAADNTNIMAMLSAANQPFAVRMDPDWTPEDLAANRFFFLHTEKRTHNQCTELLEPFLRASTLTNIQ